MDKSAIVALILVTTFVVIIADLQQEANVVSIFSQKNDGGITLSEARKRLNKSRAYQMSTVLLFMSLVFLGLYLSDILRETRLESICLILFIGIGAIACATRVASLLKIIKDSRAIKQE